MNTNSILEVDKETDEEVDREVDKEIDEEDDREVDATAWRKGSRRNNSISPLHVWIRWR